MTSNDIIRRLRFVFDFNDDQMIELFHLAGSEVSRTQVSNWLKKDEDPELQEIQDKDLATFLNGLIIKKRGKKEGPLPVPESILNNNIILRKLKIALNFRDDDILNALKLANRTISKHELSAFFRKPEHKHYRVCQDQMLRNFLQGLQKTYRD